MLHELVKRHPLASVLLLALAVRIVAVIFSQGFIQSDDFYDTVEVSYDWLRHGLWGDDGYLHWKEHAATSIVRFPLYTLFLFAVMKLHLLIGISALDRMMYSIRFIHALISLLPVYFVFKILQRYSGSWRWGLGAALLPALHFAMPFLGVRNLIEMVAGNLWIGAIYCIYVYLDDGKSKWLYAAGVMTGLAWMIRFQLAFAVLPIPFALWYEAKSVKPALKYSASVAAMLFVSALSDRMLLGYWGASSINNLALNTGLGTVYDTVPLMYILVVLTFFIPPFSFLMVYMFFTKSFWLRHRILITSTLGFVLLHMAHPNQQERFMIPVIPALMLMVCLAAWHRYQTNGYVLRSKSLLKAIALVTLVINFVLLIPFSFAYGHKGLIEPLVWFERMEPRPRVMFVQPGMHRWIPESYAGYQPITRAYMRDWSDLHEHAKESHGDRLFDYYVLYPRETGELAEYADSVAAEFGPLEKVRTFEPSLYDKTFHALNPRHYRTYRASVYRPSSKAGRIGD